MKLQILELADAYVTIGWTDVPDADAYKAEYYQYMMNGLITQLVRIQPGKNIEEAHMRNRSLIAHWCLEKGKEQKTMVMVNIDNKTFVRINSYTQLRELIGELLKEVQRIKSTGDYQAAKELVETYGVKVNQTLHHEVLSRYDQLSYNDIAGQLGVSIKTVEAHISAALKLLRKKIFGKE